MRNVDKFRGYLKRKGKKNHVVDDLIGRCVAFEKFLRKRHKSLEDADEEDIRIFVDETQDRKLGVNNYLRAVGLYYRFMSRPDLSALANDLREKRISLRRKPFNLKGFRGVKRKHISLLDKERIVDVDQMLKRGKTPHDREVLSKKTGIPLESILEYVKLSDLSRLGAIKGVRARLYFDAGVDTPDKMASWDPEELRRMLISYVERTGFDGIAPLPKELKNAVETARRIERIVSYDE